MLTTNSVSASDISTAAGRLAGAVRRTPLLPTLPLTFGAKSWRVTFKLEHLQVTGSFKARGALNSLLTLSPSERANGVITASGGNHGLAVAWAAQVVGCAATVFVPETTPTAKVERLRGYGADLRLVGREYDVARQAAERESAATGRPLISAYADPAVIAGQGTVGLELLADLPDRPDYVLVAVGGGGLIGGVSTYVGAQSPATKVVGVEPVGAATLHAALAAKRPVTLDTLNSIAADSLGARSVGPLNLELAQQHVATVALVTDADILAAREWLWVNLRQAVEPGGAAALAALMAGVVDIPFGAHIAVILCGANTTIRFD